MIHAALQQMCQQRLLLMHLKQVRERSSCFRMRVRKGWRWQWQHPPAQSRRTKGTKGREAVIPGRHWCTDNKGKVCRKNRGPGLKKGGCGRRRNG